MTDKNNRRWSQENALYLHFMCERDNYSDEWSESDVGSIFFDIDVEVGIAPDSSA